MRKFILILFIAGFANSIFAQKIDRSRLPEDVRVSFDVFFRRAQSQEWTYKDHDYMCNFVIDGKKAFTLFTEIGEWRYTLIYLKKRDIPSIVKIFIKGSDYRKYHIKSAIIYESTKQIKTYEIVLKEWKSKYMLYYSVDGAVAKIMKM